MKLVKTILVFLLLIGIIFIVKLFIFKEEFKIDNDIYFNSDNLNLILYKDNTYYMYKDNEVIIGTYKLKNNKVSFKTQKKYNSVCYNNFIDNFTGTLKGNKNIESIIIDGINIDKSDIVDKIDISDRSECSVDDTYTTSKEDYLIDEKYSHDIVINDKQINYKMGVDDKETLNKFLHQFFERYYNIMETLEYKDISDMFVSNKDAYIYKTALDLLIENRKRSKYDLSISNVKYELTVDNYSNDGNIISFTVRENCSYNFNFIKQYTSSVYNIKNEFKLVKIGNEYKISNYNKVQDFYVMISMYYDGDDNYKSSLDKIKNDYLESFKAQEERFKTMENNYLNNNYEIKKCDNEYNRKASYEYAINWVGRRNSKWNSHGDANCVNYVSQVMNAGGIPMDDTGNDNSKWYSKGNETYSWINVGGIRSYFKENTGFGLCGKYDENIYLGEIGDVILVGPKNDSKHAITVIGQIKDSNGKVIDLLVSSNTVDLIYFPLKAYAYPYKTLLKVYGYNN